MSNGSSSSLSLDHQFPPSSEQLCYLHCTRCDTVLAVSVPSSCPFKSVTVLCGHCSNLLPASMKALLLSAPPPATNHSAHNLFPPSSHNLHMREAPSPTPNFSLSQPGIGGATNYMAQMSSSRGGVANELPRPSATNRPPEKRQRVPSAYNRFIKEEIQRIKAGNPDFSHREAFSAAAKNWAHFPHIHFGMMPDQPVKRTANMRPHHPQEAGDGGRLRDGFFTSSANVGVSPY